MWVLVQGRIVQSQIRIPKKSRLAHNNIKLLHIQETSLSDICITRFADPHGGPVNKVAILSQGPFFLKVYQLF